MKKLLATIMAIFMLTGVLCATALPASAAADYTITVCGLSNDGLIWAIDIYDDFEDAWNAAINYATNLGDGTNGDDFTRIVVDFYGDWEANRDGKFGEGIGFKDGAIYVPSGAKITVNLCGHTINRGDDISGKAMYIDAGADIIINSGTIIGGIHADSSAKVEVNNVYATYATGKNGIGITSSASIFGDGSLTMIVAILALVASAVSICLTVVNKKNKAVPIIINSSDGE